MAKAVTITGDKALIKALNNIGPAINRRVIKGAGFGVGIKHQSNLSDITGPGRPRCRRRRSAERSTGRTLAYDRIDRAVILCARAGFGIAVLSRRGPLRNR